MNTRQTDHTTLREWLYLESDGELNAIQRSSLKQHLESCSSCREERRQITSLERLLGTSRIHASADFRQRVLSELPAAGWEARSPRSWIAAVVAVLVLAAASTLLIASAGGAALSAVPVAAVTAVWELLSTSALAGAGLLTASWKGLGLAIQDVLGQSIWNVIALGLVVLCLDILLVRFLLRDRSVEVEAREPDES